LLDVFHAVDNGRNVCEPDGSAIAIGNDERAVALTGDQLIVRADRVSLVWAVKSALGLINVGLAQRGAQILEAESVRSEGCGIRLDAHGRPLAAADTDEADTGKLRYFLGESCVSEVFHFGERQ